MERSLARSGRLHVAMIKDRFIATLCRHLRQGGSPQDVLSDAVAEFAQIVGVPQSPGELRPRLNSCVACEHLIKAKRSEEIAVSTFRRAAAL